MQNLSGDGHDTIAVKIDHATVQKISVHTHG